MPDYPFVFTDLTYLSPEKACLLFELTDLFRKGNHRASAQCNCSDPSVNHYEKTYRWFGNLLQDTFGWHLTAPRKSPATPC